MGYKAKVIQKKKEDTPKDGIINIIRSTFSPGDNISISSVNYEKLLAAMKDMQTHLDDNLKWVSKKTDKGTFTFFRNSRIAFELPEKHTAKDREKFNEKYFTFKSGNNFKSLTDFMNSIAKYNKILEKKEDISVTNNYKIIYHSASGSNNQMRYYILNDDEISRQFINTTTVIYDNIVDIISTIDRPDKANIKLSDTFEKLFSSIKKDNKNLKFPEKAQAIFNIAYKTFNEKMDKIYQTYILTGSEILMFVKLVGELVESVKDQKGADNRPIIGVSDAEDEKLFNELVATLEGIKEGVLKEVDRMKGNSNISEAQLKRIDETMGFVETVTKDPLKTVESIITNIPK